MRNPLETIELIALTTGELLLKMSHDRHIDVTLVPPMTSSLLVQEAIGDRMETVFQECYETGQVTLLAKEILSDAISKVLDMYPPGSNVRGN